jgi:hypothetical protein
VAAKRRKFQRPLGKRRYKKLFIIAAEGIKTEPLYFDIFTDDASTVRVSCLKGKHDSSPLQVLKRMTDHLEREELKSSDEAWLVVDKDQWTDDQLAQLHQWSSQKDNYGFALSNPKFEYWLLLHFEDGTGVTSSRDCTDRLKCRIPDYDKGIDMRKISRSQIKDAIRRAKERDNPPCSDWPRILGQTTVYRLIENILGTSKNLMGRKSEERDCEK